MNDRARKRVPKNERESSQLLRFGRGSFIGADLSIDRATKKIREPISGATDLARRSVLITRNTCFQAINREVAINYHAVHVARKQRNVTWLRLGRVTAPEVINQH